MFRILLVLSFLASCYSYKILIALPHRGKSHTIPALVLTRKLAEKGHEVTLLSHFFPKEPIENCTYINLTESGKSLVNVFDLNQFIKSNKNMKWEVMKIVQNYTEISCQKDFSSNLFRDFLTQKQNFDLIITQMFSSDCFMSLMYRFQAPVVGLVTLSAPIWVIEKFANPTNPSYIPNILLDFTDTMNFFQRIENFVMGVFHNFFYNFYILPIGEDKAKEYFGEDFPGIKKLVYNVSLLLVNSHFTYFFARPLVPAIVEVGGIHVEKSQKLPQNLEKWINESTDGVIYFSLGSMIKGHTFPEEKRQEFLKAFGRLPQRVLWKYENETMPGKPDNVMIQKWMPQLDILCHPNVKAFISHGGLLGTTEAVHCGVPVMVMPQYGDQFTNAKALEANGGGVILHLYEATEEKVYNGLKTILDPKFKRQAEDLSARFRDRPLPPLETAIYWVEYVARHRGAPHLRTAAVGMPLYKYLLLDVIAFLLLVFALIAAIFFYVARAVFRKLFQCKKDKQKTN